MLNDDLVDAFEYCKHNNIEVGFIHSLHEFGLIELTTINETEFIETAYLQKVEKLVRLHYELNINLEGIDVINYLLARMEQMQAEANELRSRLRLYES